VVLLTIQETAERLRVNPITVRRFIADGRLPAVRVGRGVRVEKDAVDQLLEPVAPKPPRTQRRAPVGRPLTYDHPLWKLVGSATDAPSTDASKKHEYLADASASRQP
jgi:excisionase family DNA binding protein